MEFDTIWTDEDDNVWAAKVVEGGLQLFTVVTGDWVQVTMLPTDSMDEIEDVTGGVDENFKRTSS